jgi:hypothetical protein
VVADDIGRASMRSAALLANSSILALMFSAACSAVMVHSGRAGQAAKGSLRSTSAIPCCSTTIGVSRVSLLRGFAFVATIDRGARHTRSASVGTACLGRWVAIPRPPWTRPLPLLLINPSRKYIRPENSRGCRDDLLVPLRRVGSWRRFYRFSAAEVLI